MKGAPQPLLLKAGFDREPFQENILYWHEPCPNTSLFAFISTVQVEKNVSIFVQYYVC